MKKFLSLLLVLTMILSLSVPISADSGVATTSVTVWSNDNHSWVSAKYVVDDESKVEEGTVTDVWRGLVGENLRKPSRWSSNLDITDLVKDAIGDSDISKVTNVAIIIEAVDQELFPCGSEEGKLPNIEIGGKALTDYKSVTVQGQSITGNTITVSGDIYYGTSQIYLRLLGFGLIDEETPVKLNLTVVPTVTANGPKTYDTLFSLNSVPVQRDNYPNWNLITGDTYQKIDTFNFAISIPGAEGVVSYTNPSHLGWGRLIFDVKDVPMEDGSTKNVEVIVPINLNEGDHVTTFNYQTLYDSLTSTSGVGILPANFAISCASVRWQSGATATITGFDVTLPDNAPSVEFVAFNEPDGVKAGEGVLKDCANGWDFFGIGGYWGRQAASIFSISVDQIKSMINMGGVKFSYVFSGTSPNPGCGFNGMFDEHFDITDLGNGKYEASVSLDVLRDKWLATGKTVGEIDNFLVQPWTGNLVLYSAKFTTADNYESPVMVRSIFGDKIALEYAVMLPASVTAPVMEFTVAGNTFTAPGRRDLEGAEIMPFALDDEDVRWFFTCEGVTPAQIGETISAKVIGCDVEIPDTSILDYCEERLANSTDTTFKQLVSELARYASTASELNNGTAIEVNGTLSIKTGEAYTNRFATTGTNWKGATLVLANTITMRLYYNGEVAADAIKVTAGDHDVTIKDGYVEITGFTPLDYDEVITAEIDGSTVSYSVGSYISRMSDKGNDLTKKIVTNLQNYGRAAEAYAAATNQN